ncbi:MAG: hypothetical protein QOH85_912 [Acidobacteriaceae bacterium]|nr:hypothetical protein [Acidobacteriaceae bacterium]
MRPIGLLVLSSVLLTPPCIASSVDDKPVDAVAISALATKASLASPKEQCFLYAELVHRMTELAGHQIKDGQDASATLRGIREYTQKIHLGVAKDTKRLKNAQILMEHTAFRLNEYLHSAAIDDRPVLESTLKNLNQVQDELMLQVFRH